MRRIEKISVPHKFSLKNKKLIIASSLMLFLVAAICHAAVLSPEWTEFCSPRHIDSNENMSGKDATCLYKKRYRYSDINKSMEAIKYDKGKNAVEV